VSRAARYQYGGAEEIPIERRQMDGGVISSGRKKVMARSTSGAKQPHQLGRQIKRNGSEKRFRKKTTSSRRHKTSPPMGRDEKGAEPIRDAGTSGKTHPLDHTIPYESQNLLNRLALDHEHIWSLFEGFQTAGGDDKCQLANKLLNELEVHANIEEELFYSELVTHGDKKMQQLVREARMIHEDFTAVVNKLRTINPQEDAFASGVDKLMQQVQCHMEEEERVLFPMAQDLLGEKLEQLGAAMIEWKTMLLPPRIA
jgi:hemerythrin superfamily protein